MCRKNEREKVGAAREKKIIVNKCALLTSQKYGEKGKGEGGYSGINYLLWIHSLSIQKCWERNEATLRIHEDFQQVQPDPQVVCVKVLMLVDILKGCFVFFRTLG